MIIGDNNDQTNQAHLFIFIYIFAIQYHKSSHKINPIELNFIIITLGIVQEKRLFYPKASTA